MKLLDCYINVFIYVLRLVQGLEQDLATTGSWRESISQELANAQSAAIKIGLAEEDIAAGHFAVVVWTDEAILCADRGYLDAWRQAPLQTEYYHSALGGITFFERLNQLPPDNHNVRAVYLFCLFLGFHGRYGENNNIELHNIIQQEIENLPQNHRDYLSSIEHPLVLANGCDVLMHQRNLSRWKNVLIGVLIPMIGYFAVILYLLYVRI